MSADAPVTAGIGVMFPQSGAIGELADFADRVERGGYEELWLAEDCGRIGQVAAAATLLERTCRLRIGLGILPIGARNAVFAAMDLATLAHLHPGRLEVAFGHGLEAWMANVGVRPRDRVVALEEGVVAVRSLLRGNGALLLPAERGGTEVRLERPPAVPPAVLVGTTGNKGIGVAARSADGLVLPEGSNPSAVAWAAEQLDADAKLVVYAWLRMGRDRDEAAEALMPAVERWVALGLYPNLIERISRREGEAFEPALAREAAVLGTAEDCRATIEDLRAAGASSIVLIPADGPSGLADVERFAAEVLPRLAGTAADPHL